MEAFISLFLGLYQSHARLTGIPMFPETTVSDCVYSHLESVRSLGVLANRPLSEPRMDSLADKSVI